MSVSYGFYNSLNHDRKYDARQLGDIFDGIITDGVYHSIGNVFAVTANSGMVVNVDSGRGWFNGTWILNDAKITVELPASHPVYSKIVAIIIRVDKANRENLITYKEGTAASSPEPPAMEKTENVFEYPLAYVTVEPGSTAITPENITTKVGTTDCPFVTGIIQGVSIDALIQNWKDQFDIMFADLEKQISQAASATIIDKSVTYDKLSDDVKSRLGQRVTFNGQVQPGMWSSTAPYVAELPINGILATDMPHITPNLVNVTTDAARSQMMDAWSCVNYAIAGSNKITFTCLNEKPSYILVLQIEVMR